MKIPWNCSANLLSYFNLLREESKREKMVNLFKKLLSNEFCFLFCNFFEKQHFKYSNCQKTAFFNDFNSNRRELPKANIRSHYTLLIKKTQEFCTTLSIYLSKVGSVYHLDGFSLQRLSYISMSTILTGIEYYWHFCLVLLLSI